MNQRVFFPSLLFVLCCLLISMLSACPQEAQPPADTASEQRPLRMGFIPSENMAEIQRNAQPLVDQLSAALGQEVQAFIANDYTGVVEAFRNDKLDFAFLSPASYVMAQREADVRVILRTQRGEAPFYHAVIFTHKDSGITSLAQLKGKTFAFGDNLSTAGYIFPLKMLRAAGLNPDTDFENMLFSGSHDATVFAVHNQKVTAGATYANDPKGDDAAWKHMLKPEQAADIRVLSVSEPIPADNLCVHPKLDAALVEKISAFFLALENEASGRELMHNLYHIDRFVPASDADYAGVREAFAEAGIQMQQKAPQ
ncbi:MAG: phosphate/phosphite/phosphonate ABC transporter substrate-binding protein [Candidatus Sericytochromatia bacterium]|nr:phosphate/phosphite/phosphonate ABC transporter substrate-binding protein [Candidatus Sericytochromatia bacterium]